MPALKEAVDYVVQKIWNENRSLIEQLVYEASGAGYTGGASAYSNNPDVDAYYKRTGEFKEAWETSAKTVGDIAEGSFNYAPETLTVNYDEWQHGSKVDREPMTTYLADIIYNGTAGDIFGEGYWTKKRDAWSVLEKWLSVAKFREIYEDGMSKAGLNFVKHGRAINVSKHSSREGKYKNRDNSFHKGRRRK